MFGRCPQGTRLVHAISSPFREAASLSRLAASADHPKRRGFGEGARRGGEVEQGADRILQRKSLPVRRQHAIAESRFPKQEKEAQQTGNYPGRT